MLINVKQQILDYRGHPVLDNGEPVPVGEVLINAANGGGKPEEDARTKTLRFRMAMRAAAALDGDGEMSVTADEVVLLRDGVARLYAPLVVGRVLEVLEPDTGE